jgi:hypothetical protein
MTASIPSWCTGVIVRDDSGVEIQFSSCRLTNGSYVLSSVLRESQHRSPAAYGLPSRWCCAPGQPSEFDGLRSSDGGSRPQRARVSSAWLLENCRASTSI